MFFSDDFIPPHLLLDELPATHAFRLVNSWFMFIKVKASPDEKEIPMIQCLGQDGILYRYPSDTEIVDLGPCQIVPVR